MSLLLGFVSLLQSDIAARQKLHNDNKRGRHE